MSDTLSRRQRLLFLTAPERASETMETIVSNIANGGNLCALCETWNVGFEQIREWIDLDNGRKEAYKRACEWRQEWTKEAVMAEFRTMARFDIRQLYDENNALKRLDQLPPEIARCIQSIQVDELWEWVDGTKIRVGDTVKVKLWDKIKAAELLGKEQGAWVEKVDHTGRVTLEQMLVASHKPPAEPAATPPAVHGPDGTGASTGAPVDPAI